MYNVDIRTLGDIRLLFAEVATLRDLYDGNDADVSDLSMVVMQLSRLENDYRQLTSEALTDDEFVALAAACAKATEEEFGADEPPLDNDALYGGIAETIRISRLDTAERWMRENAPLHGSISTMSAREVLDARTALHSVPNLLSSAQTTAVRESVVACNRRLDELEVDGLVVRNEALSIPGRELFLEMIGVGSKRLDESNSD